MNNELISEMIKRYNHQRVAIYVRLSREPDDLREREKERKLKLAWLDYKYKVPHIDYLKWRDRRWHL